MRWNAVGRLARASGITLAILLASAGCKWNGEERCFTLEPPEPDSGFYQGDWQQSIEEIQDKQARSLAAYNASVNQPK